MVRVPRGRPVGALGTRTRESGGALCRRRVHAGRKWLRPSGLTANMSSVVLRFESCVGTHPSAISNSESASLLALARGATRAQRARARRGRRSRGRAASFVGPPQRETPVGDRGSKSDRGVALRGVLLTRRARAAAQAEAQTLCCSRSRRGAHAARSTAIERLGSS